jgi:hypothetical protein
MAATPRRPLRAATRGGSRDWARLAADRNQDLHRHPAPQSTSCGARSWAGATRLPERRCQRCRTRNSATSRGGSPLHAGARPEASLSLPQAYVVLSQIRYCMLALLTWRKSRLTVLGVSCWFARESGGYGVGHRYPGLSQGQDSALPPNPAHRLPLMQPDPVRSASVGLIEGSVCRYRGRRPHGMHYGGRSTTSWSSPASVPAIEATRGQE